MNETPATAQSATPARRWLFGPAVLDERTLELVVNGEAVSVERKPLEVLLFLLNHAGEVVTKDEILEAVWPGRILTESVLTKCIAKIREALHDEHSELIKTQHGYGYRLVAKVNVEASSAPPPPRFDFKPGDHPPNRPTWNLAERLGTGGHGEVWLARHEKTREPRVFKFALDTAALVSLKREITLYRLLHDALGNKASIVEIHEWNLEQPPYFIEGEYVESGSLVSWAEAQGGLTNVPLETRLDIAAQIAETLAAAHSVGVLHKDLKPSNVLIETSPLPPGEGQGEGAPSPAAGASASPGGRGERIQIKLADFGSGGVLDPHRLESLGITRLGFTKTVAATGTTSGTPIYLAPEVVAGQPFTVQADIYALGVMLYQLVVGSFKKSLAPGWELGIEDELLREDIAGAAAGDLSRRLADAAELARRLRTLDQRRAERAAEREAREQAQRAVADAERAQQAMERMRVRRRWMAATVAVLLGGLAGSLWLYRDATRARDSAMAVSTFLTQDVLSMADPYQAKPKEMTVKAMIDRAAKLVDERLADQPEAAAQVHFAMGQAYVDLLEVEPGIAHLKKAEEILNELYGERDFRTVLARTFADSKIGPTFFVNPAERIAVWQQIRERVEQELGSGHPQVLEARVVLAGLRQDAGQISKTDAIAEMRAAIADARNAYERGAHRTATRSRSSWTLFLDPAANNLELMLQFKQISLWALLHQSGRYQEAVTVAGDALTLAEREYGKDHLLAARFHLFRAQSLLSLRRFQEAETDMRAGVEGKRAWLGEDHNESRLAEGELGNLLIQSGRNAEAADFFRTFSAEIAAQFGAESVWALQMRLQLAYSLLWSDGVDEAERLIQEVLRVLRKKPAEYAPLRKSARNLLARLRREQGRIAEAAALYEELLGECEAEHCGPEQKSDLTYMYARTQHALGRLGRAEALFRESAAHYEADKGPEDGATMNSRIELADVLREQGKGPEAWALIGEIREEVPPGVDTTHILANLYRVKGLLWLQEGKHEEARTALAEALRLTERVFGQGNWRTKRLRDELSKAEAALQR